jgi:hypothetical protein
MIGAFVGFSRIFLLGILVFKGLSARRLYKSFGVIGLKKLRVLVSEVSERRNVIIQRAEPQPNKT